MDIKFKRLLSQLEELKKSRPKTQESACYSSCYPILQEDNSDFAIILCHFNPSGYTKTVNNRNHFLKQIASHDCRLFTIELSFDGRFELEDVGQEKAYQVESKSVLWHKEALINYVAKRLPEDIRYVAWIDMDLIWTEPNWPSLAKQALVNHDIVQLFEDIYYMKPGVLDPMAKDFLFSKKSIMNNKQSGMPGGAWAARRTFFESLGLYDKCIVGCGDTIFIGPVARNKAFENIYTKYGPKSFIGIACYQKQVTDLELTATGLDLPVYHIWHGDIKNRSYIERHSILNKYGFDPSEDVKFVDGILEWATDKPDMHREVKEYFANRKEDGDA